MAERKKQVRGRNEAPLEVAVSTELQLLLQANRDLVVNRNRLGEITIGHYLGNGDFRRVYVTVSHPKEGNPTVGVCGQQIPASYRAQIRAARTKQSQEDHTLDDVKRYYELQNNSFNALRTYVDIRIVEDEQVDIKIDHGGLWTLEDLKMKIDPLELITTARRGLEFFQAYLNDPSPKTYQMRDQIADDYRPDLEHSIAEASPIVGSFMRREGMSDDRLGAQAIYALNVLNKVTDAMLPSEMPSVPQTDENDDLRQ